MNQKGSTVVVLLIVVVAAVVVFGVVYMTKIKGQSTMPTTGASPRPKVTVKPEASQSASPSAQYKNPFDDKTQYQNPFSGYKNPFNNVQ